MLDLRKLLIVLACLSFASAPFAAPADEDDEEFRPGLVAEYLAGERAVTRIDSDVAFAWDEAAPDARLSAERFAATWRGFLLVRQEAQHRLHAFVQGEVTVELDGRRVLHGSAKQPQWISGDEFSPGFGERPLVVTFRKTEPAAQLKLFWSSDAFSLEPLPPELLFHDKPHDDLALIELGRKQFDVFRCGRCHQREGEEQPPPGPSLKHFAASGIVDDVVGRHLAESPETGRVYPTFGGHDPDYEAIELFLHQQSQPVELDKPKSVKEADLETERRKGEVLLRSTGCLACHRIGELGGTSPSPFAGPDLSNVGERRTLPWLVTWLAKPERLNADHRMPVFNLSDGERNQLALALWNLTSDPDAKDSLRLTAEEHSKNWKSINDFQASKDDKAKGAYKAQTERGRKLAIELRCAACHQFSDNDAVRFEKPASDLFRPIAFDWSKSCLAERADHAQLDRPIFGENLNREAIKAFLASRRRTKLSPLSAFDRGQRAFEQKGCLACHSRHGVGGIGKMAAHVAKLDKDLNGQSPALVPPSLNAIGDKLLDEALSIAVRGERQPIRMPWLKVRMPKFKHSPDELAMLTRYFVEHDRIPEMTRWQGDKVTKNTDETHPLTVSPPHRVTDKADAHTHLAGQALTGVRGWSCIACHKIGDYEPKQVALGARGSDLKMLGKHLRPEFFFRWIASPLRVIPGVEMPQYNRPVAGVLNGDLAKQHAALWQALNDPNFQPPTNPANVEQLWVVNPGEQPRIIRDVFQLPKELGGGTVQRSFAVGFDNGHSFLFDLDTASIRHWTFGDFARQQTVGKRWVWEMAGVNVVSQLTSTQVQLRRRRGAANSPKVDGKLQKVVLYESQDQVVKLNYVLQFPGSDAKAADGAPLTVTVWDQFQSLSESIDGQQRSGIERRMQLIWPSRQVAEEFEIWIDDQVGSPSIGPTITHGPLRLEQETLSPKFALEHLTIRYSAALDRTLLAIPARPLAVAAKLSIASVPGFEAIQLPIDTSIMPTGFAWQFDQMAMTSLKGHVFTLTDADADGFEDRLHLVEEGLTAPYGLVGAGGGPNQPLQWIVAHKPELVSLQDRDGDGRADHRMVFASGWGFTDDYHEWTTGPVFEPSRRQLFVGLASDYTDKNRPANKAKWRGKVLMVSPFFKTSISPVGHAFRYPTGIAINDRDEVFVSDQQGVQNCFNEINYLVEGAHYGVPSTHEEDKDAPETKAAIQIPHPWTRSVNGIVFLTGKEGYPDLKGHGIGCEYNGRFLIRFTTQRVGDVMQGAVYPFSLTDDELVRGIDKAGPPLGATNAIEVSGGKPAAPRQRTVPNFEGPLCCGVSPKGEIYIGSIADSGWAGGQNTGSIVKLKGNGQRPNGIREIRATHDGFDIDFFAPVDRVRATNSENYSISGYTRVWGGTYATPDSDRHRCKVLAIELSDNGKSAKLKVDSRKTPNYVYDISCREVAEPDKPLWPGYGFLTLHRIPTE